MNDEELKIAIVDLLYDLHTMNLLNSYVLKSISLRFKIDAYELCDENGITYFVDP